MTNNFFIDPRTGLPFMGSNINIGKFDIPTGTDFILTDSSDLTGKGYTSASKGIAEDKIKGIIENKKAPSSGTYSMFKKRPPAVINTGFTLVGDTPIVRQPYTSASKGLSASQINNIIKGKNPQPSGLYSINFKKQLPAVISNDFALTNSSDLLGRGYTSASSGLTEAQINDIIKKKNTPPSETYRWSKPRYPAVINSGPPAVIDVRSGVPDIIRDTLPKGATAKAGANTTAKEGAKASAKAGAKAGAKVGGKVISKFVPGLGLVAGLGAAGADLVSGDYPGAGLNALSGVTSLIPGVGTAASLGLDAVNFMRESGEGKDAAIPAAAVGIPALMRMSKGGKVAGVASKFKDFAKAHPKLTQASAFAAGPLAYNIINSTGGEEEVPLQGSELQPPNLKPVQNIEAQDIGIPPELTGVPEDTLAQLIGSGAGILNQQAVQQPTAQGNIDAILQLANQQSTYGDRYKQSLQDLIDVMPQLNELEYQRRLGLAMMSPVMKNKELMEVMKSKSAVNDLANMVDLEKSLYDQEVTQQQLQNKILGNIQVARAMGLPDDAALADPDVLGLFQKLRSSEIVSDTAMQKALLQEGGANARKNAELKTKMYMAEQDILNTYGTPGLAKAMLSAGIPPEQMQANIDQLRLLGLIPNDTNTDDGNDSDVAKHYK